LTPHHWYKGFNQKIYFDFLNKTELDFISLDIRITQVDNVDVQYSLSRTVNSTQPYFIEFKVIIYRFPIVYF
jgi:hypothetical protein